jgi:uncharacterized protein (DUF1778 family)
VLVPSGDPPFVTVCFPDSNEQVQLRARDGRELIRRLEERGEHRELLARIFAARRAPFPQRFVAESADETALVAALDDPPDVPSDRLAELRNVLRSRPGI